jgi:hypothetical protein
MKKLAREGESTQRDELSPHREYTKGIGKVSTRGARILGNNPRPLANGLFARGYVGMFRGFFADTDAKKPKPILTNANSSSKTIFPDFLGFCEIFT